MKKQFLILFLSFLNLTCVQAQQAQNYKTLGKDDRIRNYSVKIPKNLKIPEICSPDDYAYQGAEVLQGVEDFTLDLFNDAKVTAADVNKFGDEAFNEIKESGKYHFITSGQQLKELQKMLQQLLKVRKNKSGIHYQIHLIKDDMINAFTVGGHIIITTAIIEEAGSLSAVAAIIGHEIGHNEKEHLHKTIKKLKVAKEYVSEDAGKIALGLQHLLMPAFNQPNEIEADLYGVDLCYAAGFNPKAVTDFWSKMSKKEHKSQFESFLRSHPFSINRMKCINTYIKMNYKL